MRIFLDYRPALRQRTGVGEYAHELARALLAILPAPDHQLTLFSSSWKDRVVRDGLQGARIVDVRVPVRLLNYAWHRLEWPPVERFAGQVDLTHSMHPLLLPARRAAQVVTIHDLYFLDRPESTAAEIRRDYAKLAASHARRADAVIVVSDYTAGQVEARLDVPPERITVCRPGAPPWGPRDPSVRGAHVLFVGSIEARKNIAALFRAYARLLRRMPDAPPLILAGKPGPDAARILEPLGQAPLARRARYVGYVSDGQREQLYKDAAVFVLPSLNEGFGIPALEAMTAGVPVVAANRGALPELVEDAGVLVEPEDDEALANALERLLRDDALARRCAESGIRRSRSFTWAASASRLARAYAAAIEYRQERS